MKICVAKEPEGIGAVKEEGDWEELELTVDSGATDTVIQPMVLPSVEVTEGPAFKRGVEYEMANGEHGAGCRRFPEPPLGLPVREGREPSRLRQRGLVCREQDERGGELAHREREPMDP